MFNNIGPMGLILIAVVVLVLFGGLALYVDEELRGQAAKLLNALGLEGALVGIAPASAAPAAAS